MKTIANTFVCVCVLDMVHLNDTKKGKLSNNPFVQGVIKEKKKNITKRKHTGKEEHISAKASPTNQVKNVTTTHPHIKLAGPA